MDDSDSYIGKKNMTESVDAHDSTRDIRIRFDGKINLL